MTVRKFVPAPGQVDCTDLRNCPVFHAIIMYAGNVLMVERSGEVEYNARTWAGVCGFLDDRKKVVDKTLEELEEELGMKLESIHHLEVIRPPLIMDDDEHDKSRIVFPVRVVLKAMPYIVLDWEAVHSRWVPLQEVRMLPNRMPGFDQVFEAVTGIQLLR